MVIEEGISGTANTVLAGVYQKYSRNINDRTHSPGRCLPEIQQKHQ